LRLKKTKKLSLCNKNDKMKMEVERKKKLFSLSLAHSARREEREKGNPA